MTTQALEGWRHAWRNGLGPACSDQALETLRAALEADSPELCQGLPMVPAPVPDNWDEAIAQADPLAFLGWRGEGLRTVLEADEFVWAMAAEVDRRLGEPMALRPFFRWWDDTGRAQAVRQLLGEVCREQGRRAAGAEPGSSALSEPNNEQREEAAPGGPPGEGGGGQPAGGPRRCPLAGQAS